MIWSSEADAKLFVGVLNQLRGKLKLDYQELAMHMGGDCTSCAVEQRMIRLRKQAASASPAACTGTGGGTANTTPTTTPRKRKGDGLATPAKKKTKNVAAGSAKSEVKKDDATTINEDGKAEIKVKPEIKNEPVE
ncbi:uncharacterized protein AKAW2_80028A [Aspergillus luchuensis]|uniref:Uncharacterized protein n=2 Tax=Aspergillus kawachii TaxID=1069201 RepID=A0A146F6S8_ASPKA|nr:uncharacterized protein AKAW2_80028A [Aspergillus luchuensis]OJZ81082.1 hypothetical protein ASPFODRAFT_212322 [Aspergillus luchuensis CBS 106.47]GAA84159.1 hypothetical protein AKAW_02274 [Aspergillus luchuensis IFO 4308]BCS04227.1 hypothetical protein AKAW2_80028A [Aspergillus luchuensis]BCS15820.1 hypothetical protein ALUC_80027A [Aspergillus luchuensis]GAT22004.1 hypothetical protein RIB2604_01500330 [Aspergillus luchuensis]